MYIETDGCEQLLGEDFTANTSFLFEGLFGFGPYYEYEKFKATQDGLDIRVDWSLTNGVVAWARSNAAEYRRLVEEALANGQARPQFGETISPVAGLTIGQAIFQAIELSIGLDSIDGEMKIAYDRATDRYSITHLKRDPYPSMEVYYYENGVFQYALDGGLRVETPAGPEIGLSPNAPRDTIP
jgi:hypothetical protein